MPVDLRGISDIEEFRDRARRADINALSGRDGLPDLTQYIAAEMFKKMGPSPAETVVDIGCGDASFLILTRTNVGADVRLVGILPTQDEVRRVRDHVAGLEIEIVCGTAEDTTLPPRIADVIVCNSVLMVVPGVPDALREIARIAKPGARIYLGEIPTADELEGKRIPKWRVVASNVRRFGPVAGMKVIAYLIRCALGGRWRDHATRNFFYAEPARFVQMCREAGLQVVDQFPYPRLPSVQRTRPLMSYVFQKV
jgi:ubiquinone/menaquinone biosynthesis C-methylase UbiE